jgi:hypothetical protein
MTEPSPAEDMRPAEIDVLTGSHCVVLIVDPQTAETIAASHELAGHLGIFDEKTRPQWRREAERIAAAAATARRTEPTEHEVALGAIPLRPLAGFDVLAAADSGAAPALRVIDGVQPC